MSVAKLCEKYGFTHDLILGFIKIKSKFDIWYIEKGVNFKEREIELYHENPIDRQEFRRRITDRNNFNINQNCIWHKQKTPLMNIEEVFEYISGHDKKYFE
jgi:hypothetical protein